MPSKKYNGNSPLGGSRIEGFADVELEVAKRSPKQSLTTGLVQTHNGAIHAPKRRRRRGGAGGSTHPWKVSDASTTSEAGVWEPKIRVYGHSLGNYPKEFGGTLYWFTISVQEDTQFVLAQKNIGATLISNEPGEVSEENPDGDSAWELATNSYPIATVFADPIEKQINIGQLAFTRLGYVPGCVNGVIGRVIVAV